MRSRYGDRRSPPLVSAFRHRAVGQIVLTPGGHDIGRLPGFAEAVAAGQEDAWFDAHGEAWEDGFVRKSDPSAFLTRAEAAALLDVEYAESDTLRRAGFDVE